ncbi:U2AF65-like splicing factor [Trypanosoma grayi]|uniref:U2AF65-like splicing factor n=1 Tax=Trypanosoma grayi TaxID=71804 RepID=UPI0004F47D88|nr:U2AF65-like splicing factor [Trypanosoma grayi]KEG15554.1 U2AF65-like splicing factor [Trypanosoma grayi]
MGRDSRGDRYARRNDAGDRHGVAESNNNNSSSGTAPSTRYGRYAGTRRSRSRSPRGGRRRSRGGDDRSSDRHRRRRRSESEDRQRRRIATSGTSVSKEGGKRGRHRSHSRSRSQSSSSSNSRKGGGGGRKRFETVNVHELLQPELAQASMGMVSPMSSEMILALIQQQQQQQQQQLLQQQQQADVSGDVDPTQLSAPAPEAASPQGGVDDCCEQLQQEGEQQEQREEELTEEGAAPQPAAPAKVLPSVADFVPVIPKSLLNLLSAPASSNTGGGGAASTTAAGEEAQQVKHQGVLTTTTGALAVLQAPKLSPEAERRAREARRAHISCFPQRTTRQELLEYFTNIIPMVRQVKVRREMDELAEQMRLESGDLAEVERREIPPNAIVDVDRVIDLAVNSAKSKPFAFLEVNLADLVTELVEESQRDPDRFIFTALDGQSYPITIRRPRDYQALLGVDKRKVVMLGFPASLSAEKLRAVFEQFGPLLAFDVKAGMAYGEFEKEVDAIECVRDLHGETLGNNVVVMMPLYDWLKVVCTHADIDVALDPDDPVSGASLLAKDAQTEGALVPVLADDVAKEEVPVDHMKELVELTVSLPDVVLHFSKTFNHLTALYGSTVPIFPTRLLVLLNLFDEEELVLDETYNRLVDEIAGEVEKHGRVKLLIVPRRTPPPLPPKPPKTFLASRIKTTKRQGGGGGGGGGVRGRPYQQSRRGEDAAGNVDALPPHASSSSGTGAPWTASSAADNAAAHEEGCDRRGDNDSNDGDDNNEVDEEAQYEKAKMEYLQAREAYTEKLMHPIHGGFGRVFVEYESVDEAAAAQRTIAGRLFGGRTVVTSFMFEDVLYPPTAEEAEMEANEKVKQYLEAIGAGTGNDNEEEGHQQKVGSDGDAAQSSEKDDGVEALD